MSDAALDDGARVTVERLGVASADAFLVVYNPEVAPIAEALERAARELTSSVRAVEFAPTGRHGLEPPGEVAAAMAEATAMALVTQFSLSHTSARLAATRTGARVASMPGITEDMFRRTIPIDYGYLETLGRSLAGQLSAAGVCQISAPGGTDVELSLRGRSGRSDDGDLRGSGAFGNMPAGEAYIAPDEQGGQGTIVFDASVASSGIIERPITVHFERGRAVRIEGGPEADTLAATLDAGGPTGRVIAELGIGTNPGATITGRILEDEKVEGTIHIAFGTNTGIGGQNESSVHIDGVILGPTVALDGRVIMREGRLVE
jgi:leucyl aminopeptidase (aminopeptidase T)